MTIFGRGGFGREREGVGLYRDRGRIGGRRRCGLGRGDESLRVDREAGTRDRLLAQVGQNFRHEKQGGGRVSAALGALFARLGPLWLAVDVNCLQRVGRQESGVAGLG